MERISKEGRTNTSPSIAWSKDKGLAYEVKQKRNKAAVFLYKEKKKE
jgi:hypothetical protein